MPSMIIPFVNGISKLKVAASLWKEVRDSDKEKRYSDNLLRDYEDKIKAYRQ